MCGASAATSVELCRPRVAEHTVLHHIVREHLPTFLNLAAERDDHSLRIPSPGKTVQDAYDSHASCVGLGSLVPIVK